VAHVLVTGMSGVGKSTALGGLADRDVEVVETDDGDWCVVAPVPGAPRGTVDRVWREDRMTALLDDRAGRPLVVAGTVPNQGRFHDRFDAVVLLSAPLDVMLDRVARRVTNPFGRTEAERARIVADTRVVVPLLRAACTHEIDTSVTPPDAVVDRLVQLALRPGALSPFRR
jgi:broad-specificity NMP kinase